MKLYLAANDKNTAGEISDALGKTTKLSVSDSVSRDRDFLQRRSVSRRMEERPLLTPDEVRRLNPDQAILIPERQNPLLVQRIVYFRDPLFRRLVEAQSGPLPYPSSDGARVSGLAARVEELERQVKGMMVVDFVRPGKEQTRDGGRAAMEPKLASEVIANPVAPSICGVASGLAAQTTTGEANPGPAQSGLDLGVLRPEQRTAIDRMRRFSQKLQGIAG